MNKPLVFMLLAAFLALLPACGSSPAADNRGASALWDTGGAFGGSTTPDGQGSSNAENFYGAGAFPGYFPAGAALPSPGSTGGMVSALPQPLVPITDLELGPRRDLPVAVAGGSQSLARISLEVESVQGTTVHVQAIAQGVGGFVERLSSSGGAQAPRSEIVIKVPQAQFISTMERIEALGNVQFRSLGSVDVTDQHIDLTARLATYRQEEQSLNSLLERSNSVAELLSIERELARVQTGIERAQAQLDLLERQVDLATIHVALFPSGTVQTGLAAGSFTIDTSNISERVVELREYITGRRGVVDQFYLSSSPDGERAEVVFRVYADDFNRTAQFLERQGRVTSRQLVERRDPTGQEGSRMRRPNARIQVAYLDRPPGLNIWAPFAVILGIAILAGGVAYLMRQAYTRGRRRGSFI